MMFKEINNCVIFQKKKDILGILNKDNKKYKIEIQYGRLLFGKSFKIKQEELEYVKEEIFKMNFIHNFENSKDTLIEIAQDSIFEAFNNISDTIK